VTTRGRLVTWLVALCYFIEMMDGTIVVTAAPQLRAALHLTSSTVSLVIAAYVVVMAVAMPLGGWLVARVGPRWLFLSSVALFTVASLAAGASHNLGQLLLARVIQGVGAACMVPIGRMVVLAKAEKTELPRLLASIIWPGLLAPVLAPLIGGLIVTYATWHWLFWCNVPLGIVAVASGWLLLEPTRITRERAPFDWWGMATTSLGLAALLTAASLASQSGGSWAATGAWFVLGALSLALAQRHLRRTPHPYVALSVLQIRSLRSAVEGLSVFVVVCSAVPLLLPLMLQDGDGWSPVKSGVGVLALFAGNIGMKPATSGVLRRWRHRPVLAVSTLTLAASLVALGSLPTSAPLVVVVVVSFVSGAARSMGFTTYFTLFYSDVPEARMNDATTVTATVQQLATGIGVSAAVVLLRVGSWWSGESATSPAAFRGGFLLLATGAFVAAGTSARLDHDAGRAVRGR